MNATSGRAQDGPGAGAGAVTEQFVVFDLAGESYGLPVSSVREVLRVPPAMTRLPRSPEIIAGAIEVRGTVLAVIDQRRRFGLPPGNADARRRIIVLEGGGTAAGLLVDGVSRLLRLSSDAVRSAPDLAGEADTAVGRVATLENGELLPIVDARALLNGTEKAIRAVAKRSDGSGSKANTGA
ncbi:chemotaxis protein CheW (plasmid) [Methylobacterium sp. NMS12]|uniref:chemotaxis protein CheW n=1 Tax=Methylobacterium sp. NMS12 TaxID=3079766 RepID=UPI003F884A57